MRFGESFRKGRIPHTVTISSPPTSVSADAGRESVRLRREGALFGPWARAVIFLRRLRAVSQFADWFFPRMRLPPRDGESAWNASLSERGKNHRRTNRENTGARIHE